MRSKKSSAFILKQIITLSSKEIEIVRSETYSSATKQWKRPHMSRIKVSEKESFGTDFISEIMNRNKHFVKLFNSLKNSSSVLWIYSNATKEKHIVHGRI